MGFRGLVGDHLPLRLPLEPLGGVGSNPSLPPNSHSPAFAGDHTVGSDNLDGDISRHAGTVAATRGDLVALVSEDEIRADSGDDDDQKRVMPVRGSMSPHVMAIFIYCYIYLRSVALQYGEGALRVGSDKGHRQSE